MTAPADQPSASSSNRLVHVRQLSVLTWKEREAQQACAAAAGAPTVSIGGSAQQAQLQLAVEPAEGFAATLPGGFDAAAVQQEVQDERPQLGAQLALLREREQREELPGPNQLQHEGLPPWPCRQNCVAPPPPPPLPPGQHGLLAYQAIPVQQQGWQQPVPAAVARQQAWQPWLAVPGQQHVMPQHRFVQPPAPQQQAWPPPPPPMQQQGHIMRPLYHQQPSAALHPAAAQPQYYQLPQQVAMQPYPWQPPPGMMLMPAPPPGPPPGDPPVQSAGPSQPGAPPKQQQQQQQQHLQKQEQAAGPDNKRAAGDLKAQLQVAKRQRQDDGTPSDAATGATNGTDEAGQPLQQKAGTPADTNGQQQQELPPQQPDEQQPWLAGAPPCIRQLAARQRGSGGGSSSGSGPEVLFLGTGSAEPSKYRGASAIQLRWAAHALPHCWEAVVHACCGAAAAAAAHLRTLRYTTPGPVLVADHAEHDRLTINRRLSCGQSLLLDCGEGTLGALCRAHGTAAALRQVASIGCLWVSHRHAGAAVSGSVPASSNDVAQAVNFSFASLLHSQPCSAPAPTCVARPTPPPPSCLPASPALPQTTCLACCPCWLPTPPRCPLCWSWGRARCATGWLRRRHLRAWRGATCLCTARRSTSQVSELAVKVKQLVVPARPCRPPGMPACSLGCPIGCGCQTKVFPCDVQVTGHARRCSATWG